MATNAGNNGQINLQINGSLFLSNIARLEGGGALSNRSFEKGRVDLRVNESDFHGNTSQGFGGVALNHSLNGQLSAAFSKCLFGFNQANFAGGAIASRSFFGGLAQVGADSCIFNGNTASAYGGAVFSEGLEGACFVYFGQSEHETCAGMGNGSITILANAPAGTLLYSINGGASFTGSNVFNNLPPGNYSVKVIAQGVASNCPPTVSAFVNAGGVLQTWYKDLDNDGFKDGFTQQACLQPNGFKVAATAGDCNDNDPTQFPGQNWYKDLDNDGYSNGTKLVQCSKPAGYKAAFNLIATSGDCQDGTGSVSGTPSNSMANIHPGATEVCNCIDEDCDGTKDEGLSGNTYVGNVTFTTQAQVNAFPTCYTVIQGNLTIQNTGITSLTNLANLSKVTGNVTIKSTGLTNLNGLNNLDTIGGLLQINSKSLLTTLTGLEDLDKVGGNLLIYNNLKLSFCCPVEHFILYGGVGGSISIYNNKTGCNSTVQILSTCPSLTPPDPPTNFGENQGDYFEVLETLYLFPNPASEEVKVQVSEELEEAGTLQIADAFGRKIMEQKTESGERNWLIS